MEELIKYFEQLEARIATLEAEVAELKNRPLPGASPQSNGESGLRLEGQVKETIVPESKPVEVIKEVVVEKPVAVAASVVEPEPEVSPDETGETPDGKGQTEEPAPIEEKPAPVEETASPKAAIYGKAVEDIRQAISLGDRFLYQRELFGQNAELMQKALTELNALSSFDEAMNYIRQFGWDTESSTYQQFIVTLHRRFG